MARRYQGRAESGGNTRSNAVVVNGYSEQWLRQGFPWVYPKEVVARPTGLSPGQTVRLETQDGTFMGVGLWDSGWIAVRRFRADPGPIEVEELLDRALALRRQIIDPGTTAYRLVAAENDGLPGIRVDVWGWYVVLTLDSASLMPLVERIGDWLERTLQPRGIHLAWRIDPRDTGKTAGPERLLRGHETPADVRVTERGVALLVRPTSKDVGLFTDMRENRAWLEPHWGGRRVLNLFAHTGAFSVCAALGGASQVTSVDLSEHYLERARANFVANELDPSAYDFVEDDVRKALDRMRRTGETWDMVLLDPPSFSHGPQGALSVEQDYGRLVASSLRVLERDGWLVAALNHGKVSPKQFSGFIVEGARKANRGLQLLHVGGQAPDHPAAAWFPEGRYLKFAIYRAV